MTIKNNFNSPQAFNNEPKKHCRWWLNLSVGIISVVLLILMLSANLSSSVLKDFQEWRADTMFLIQDYKSIYSLCQNVSDKNKLATFEQDKLFEYYDNLSRNVNKFIRDYENLGQLVSPKTYEMANDLVCWMRNIEESVGQKCNSDLKDNAKMDIWRDKMIQQINIDLTESQTLLNRLKNLIPGFIYDPRSKLYKKSPCELNRVSKY